MKGNRGSDALAAARAAARARREEARALAEQARLEHLTPAPEPEPEPQPETQLETQPETQPLPVFYDLPRGADTPPRPARPERPERPERPAPDRHFGRGVTSPSRPAREPRAARTRGLAWYPPLVGLWAAAFVVTATLDADGVRLAGAGVLAVLAVVFFAALRTPDRTPPSVAVAVTYTVAVVGTAVVGWLLAREVHPAAGALLAGVVMTGLVAAYEHGA